MATLDYSYNKKKDVLTVEGVQYSGDFFRAMSKAGIALNEPFKIVRRDDDTITIERIRDANLSSVRK